MRLFLLTLLAITLFAGCAREQADILIRNGLIYDGSGNEPFNGDMAIRGGKIVALGTSLSYDAGQVIDAEGLAVSPGFIDALSWACGPILYDGEVHSVVRQGITTAIFGEGWSMGPLNDRVRDEMKTMWPEYNIQWDWSTLHEYLQKVEDLGSSVNVASFVGATTARIYTIGMEDRPASAEELEQMKQLVRHEMENGALGVASSLVYTPAFYASTAELTELAKVAGEFNGVYVSHLRSESTGLLSALDEFLTICRNGNVAGEVYHLKAAGTDNWDKLDSALTMLEQARANGLNVAADIYPYTAGATGLSAMMPPWAKDGGDAQLIKRLKNPDTRKKILDEVANSTRGWENFYRMSGGGEGIMVSYLSEKNRALQGKTIAEIADLRGTNELETIADLLIEEKGGGGGIYFFISEENIRRKLQVPWISFCTDEDAYRTEGLMAQRNPHPRAYGTFPRILGKYVRDEAALPLADAIRRMTALPAEHLGITERGRLKEGYFADVVIFDPNTVMDKAEYGKAHQYPVGIDWVMVNGAVVVNPEGHTGLRPGKFVRRGR
jgi:N-acyl-D-amino-acid deacylase